MEGQDKLIVDKLILCLCLVCFVRQGKESNTKGKKGRDGKGWKEERSSDNEMENGELLRSDLAILT